jgi:hypothetical protein
MSSRRNDGLEASRSRTGRGLRRVLPATSALLLTVGVLSVTSASAQATDATWTGTAATGDWSLPDNWLGQSVPGSSIGTLTLPDLGTSCDDVDPHGDRPCWRLGHRQVHGSPDWNRQDAA